MDGKVRYRASNKQFVHSTDGVYRGLQPLLRDACWPKFSFHRLSEKYETERRANRSERPADTDLRGAAYGKRVHEELHRVVQSGHVPGRKGWFEARAHLLAGTVALLKKVHSLGMQPIATELVVYDEPTRLASAIDLVCVLHNRARPTYVLLEVKCGYYDTLFVRSLGHMRHSNRKLRDAPCNQAALQIVACKHMLESRLRGTAAVATLMAGVVHVEGSHVTVTLLDHVTVSLLNRVFERVKMAASANPKLGRGHHWSLKRKPVYTAQH